ncbi:MAG: hypothetical protein CGU29_12765 [Candidatus Dactylopiibacterium carminicum]|uniref:Mor transcription activator domain-containing protein n=1 Tax=Candidatus Dactylopiibacterium carminicum TaxID=857335 RepID=A0A272EPU5_9RHOO|nr:Mor transcription activator family protein [Candidatus Dactylopiibacterium carminicum]KAF7598385.1 hypothetical protein BGI27_13395 [Candidatus Dactylopiibacterium carminicum]PAS92132.1 MAG: hypothetical protein CGU29_12765 [Candidatus Dactylopiibacterium carminicum]
MSNRSTGMYTPGGLVRKRGSELLAHFSVVMTDQLRHEGIELRKAEEISVRIMKCMRKEFGGQNVYFAKETSQKIEEKAAAIYDKWQAGTAIEELAHEYDHSIQWVYRLIADERARRCAERDAKEANRRAADYSRWKREN